MTSIAIDRTDGLSSSTAYKGPCRVATTANITLSGEQTIDGVAIVDDDRVLVRAQTSSIDNGIYVADTGLWRRAKDFAGSRDVRKGTRVWVTEGDSGPAEFEVTTENPIDIGVSEITFELSAGSVNAAALSQAVILAEGWADTAEDFSDIAAGYASDAVSQGNVPIYGTVAGISALTIPPGITDFRTLGYAAIGDNGAWTNVIEVTNSGTLQPYQRQSNGGTRRWQLNENNPCIEMFGGAADCVTSGGTQENPTSITSGTDNLQPFYDMIAYQRARYTSTIMNVPIAPVRFNSPGSYRFSAHVNVKLTVKIMGLANAGTAGPMTQRCVFPNGESGFIFHRSNTIDYTTEAVTFAATGSIWDGSAPAVVCCGTPSISATSYGLQMRTRCEFFNPRVYNFAMGIRIVAVTSSGDTSVVGNANGWRIWSGRLARNVYGLYIQEGDSNAGATYGVDLNGNLLNGIYDNSFLGCDHFAPYTDGNSSGTYLAQAHNLGGTFMCLDPVLAPTTEPLVATSDPKVPYDASPVWYYKGTGSPGTTAPQWVTGTQVFYRGGGVLMINANSHSNRYGGYDEPNQAYGYVQTGCHAAGGNTLQMGPGVIETNTSLTGMSVISSNTIATESNGTLVEVARFRNRASGSNRLTRHAWVTNYLVDGITQKVMAVIDAGKDTTGNPTLKIGLNTGADSNLFDFPLQFLGGSVKRVVPVVDTIWSFGIASQRWLEGFFVKMFFGAGATFITSGTGTPEGAVTAPIGSLYTRTDGGAATTLYVKESGAGNTGWVAK